MTAADTPPLSRRMGGFERHLTWWVLGCIGVGTALGYLLPGAFATLGAAEIAKVNLPVAVLIWLMIIPMLLKIDFRAMGDVKRHWKGIGVTVYIGKQRGHASTSDFSPKAMRDTVDAALSIARFTASDDCAGLADYDLLARDVPDLDLWHPWDLPVERAIALAKACESAGFAVDPQRSYYQPSGRGLEIRVYTPAEVKSAVTGNGRADKEQVARMVRLLLAVRAPEDARWASDATDALAVALCCAQRLRFDRLREQVVLP